MNPLPLHNILTNIATKLSVIPSIQPKTISYNIKILTKLHEFYKHHILRHQKNHVDTITTKYLQHWHKHHTLDKSPTSPKKKLPMKFNYITDSDSNPPTPQMKSSSSSNKFTAAINQTYHDSPHLDSQSSPSDTSSLPPNTDPFNYDHPHQYKQGYYDNVKQQLHQTPYDSDDLYKVYCQGCHDEHHY